MALQELLPLAVLVQFHGEFANLCLSKGFGFRVSELLD